MNLLRLSLVAAAFFLAGFLFPHDHSAEELASFARTSADRISGARDVQISGGPAARRAWESAMAREEGPWRELESIKAWRCLAECNPALAWSESFRLTEGAELRATLSPDAAQAAAWIASTPEAHRGEAAIEAASLLMKRSPEEALLLAADTTDPERRRDMELLITSEWGRTDPAAAAAWCLAQPDNSSLLSTVITAWSAADLQAASAWLNTQPAGPARDAAALSLIEPLMELEPASALAWAQSLTNPEFRRATEERIAGGDPQ